jgi:potassium-dependent mechanosensitive channel
VFLPAGWFVLQLWGLTGAGYDAVFKKAIWVPAGTDAGPALTWANVINALVTTAAAYYFIRFVRDLLRFVLLPRTALDTGLRYTIVTLVSYLLVAVSGVVVLGGQLKVEAAVIGGFVAALGVGLGFGLKEIVDNFFSGIILLVERPVKVGDVINVGATTGRVDRINMRSTMIMTADNKGLIVPNKDLISQQVTNWSAGTPTVRTSFRIGIEYGADTALFRKVALEALDSFGLVLKTPSPEVLFRGFGASSLDFEVFYWIRLSTNGMRLMSDLHFALESALRRAGVGIPYPRHDVVIHPSSELRVRQVDGAPVEPRLDVRAGAE